MPSTGGHRRSERRRDPAPVLRRRVPSGRGATAQPNVTDDGAARLSTRFWLSVLATGVVAGLVGSALMGLLHVVERLAFGAGGDAFTDAVRRAEGWERVLPVLVAGVVAGVCWPLLRRLTPGANTDVDDVLWTGEGRLSFRRSAGTSVLSEVVVGLGASLGREAAPKLMGAVCGNLLGGWLRHSPPQVRLLAACGAGAGFACVYNVPLGGALFTAEVLIGAVNLPVVLPALACSGTATLTAWIFLPHHATYDAVPDYATSPQILVLAVLLGPVLGLVAVGYVRLIGWVSHHRVRNAWSVLAPVLALAVLAGLGLLLPELLGNGQAIADEAFLGRGTLLLLLALSLLKPLVTVMCLGSGASGGVFTPVLATGAALGGAVGVVCHQVWPSSPVGAYAMIAAAAMMGAAMQAPLAALALVLELTHTGFGLVIPMVLATVGATAVARWLDGYSIYSARLGHRPGATERDGLGAAEAGPS